MWQAAGRAAQSSAESVWTHGRRGWWWWGRYGGSVAASHWCALSYVGINHDSEMTYFLTPQTNSTFNRSQGFCQSTFSPCSLSKKRVACRIRLPRHNTEDYIYVCIYLFISDLRHHLLLCCTLEHLKLQDNNFLLLMCWTTYEQSPFLIHWIVWFRFIWAPASQREFLT